MPIARPAPTAHTLDDLAGYNVRRTMAGASVLAAGEIVGQFTRATAYGAAVELAGEHRTPGSWAVVDNVYSCGCTSLTLGACRSDRQAR